MDINGTRSHTATINIGVPQGSVLGPLLFLLFKNNMPSDCKFFTILFADDTTLQYNHECLEKLIRIANLNLNSASNWFNANRLTLNAKKTKCMLFSPNDLCPPFPLNLKINIWISFQVLLFG